MAQSLTRRSFIRYSALGVSAVAVSMGVTGCFFDSSDSPIIPIKGKFSHGVASGDPLSQRVILWTRFLPEQDGKVVVRWQVATDATFSQVVNDGQATVQASSDYTLKVDVAGLAPDTT
ncbi:MAG: PhoD-like phosphatase N-terminal domain-containing protein, partial [Pseudomonadota bacterium]|nr:PhoD-like phosphatase N-terminal domain-containing protein [Pseudomonadota bacterium]